MSDSETAAVKLNLNRLWQHFDRYFPTGHYKRIFQRSFDEKVKLLDQSKILSICMTRHKDLDLSFQVNKKKGSKNRGSTPNTPKKAQPGPAAGPVNSPVTKKQKLESVKELSSESSESDDDDLDAKLRKYISQGFAN